MILSFHPCFTGHRNINCAGRSPDEDDLAAILSAGAVVLPQGCSHHLYEMARQNCRHVFPNYDARFQYPGKTGQAKLFSRSEAVYPKTVVYRTTRDFMARHGHSFECLPFEYPFVFKFDWGGEGETVFFVASFSKLQHIIGLAAVYEKSGQTGFLLQEYIPAQSRSLRVVVIGETTVSYWRESSNEDTFHASLSKGATIDAEADPSGRQTAVRAVRKFCNRTGINLAGFDLLFAETRQPPYFLEINYFFGRQGLGGSEAYYKLLYREIEKWLASLKLK
jgi:ribosomal protein S6--L-glutamate ligase